MAIESSVGTRSDTDEIVGKPHPFTSKRTALPIGTFKKGRILAQE
jgi:hypothetical protein